MFKLGLTGGIGSGKTLVCRVFEKLGVPVYYADIAARELMNTDEVLKARIRETFGDQSYDEGKLNRQLLADAVFGDRNKLDMLNRLVHPAVRMDFLKWAAMQNESPYVIEEAAILFESGASKVMDQTVLVYAPAELRIRRVMQRDGLEREDVIKRMDHQLDEEVKKKMADHVLLNDGKEMLLPQIVALHNWVLNRRE